MGTLINTGLSWTLLLLLILIQVHQCVTRHTNNKRHTTTTHHHHSNINNTTMGTAMPATEEEAKKLLKKHGIATNEEELMDLYKKLTSGKEENAGKKADIAAVPITFAFSMASTYLKSYLSETKSVMMNIVNFSGSTFIQEGCQADSATDIPLPPDNLVRKGGRTQITADNASRGTKMWRTVYALFILHKYTPEYMGENLKLRCAFKKVGLVAGKTVRVVIFMTLRGGLNTKNKMPTSLAVGVCQDEAVAKTPQNCDNYDDYKKMKDLAEELNSINNKPDAILKEEEKSKIKERENIFVSREYEKTPKAGQAKVPLDPIYFCNNEMKTCVSAMMGNGGKAAAQIYIHDYFTNGDIIPPTAKDWEVA